MSNPTTSAPAARRAPHLTMADRFATYVERLRRDAAVLVRYEGQSAADALSFVAAAGEQLLFSLGALAKIPEDAKPSRTLTSVPSGATVKLTPAGVEAYASVMSDDLKGILTVAASGNGEARCVTSECATVFISLRYLEIIDAAPKTATPTDS